MLLVGGSSSIPAFQKCMEDIFGANKVLRGMDPMTCVAQGAGILAKSLVGIACICGQENPLDASECRKCGADLTGVREKQAEEAPAMAMNVEAYSRTAKHYTA